MGYESVYYGETHIVRKSTLRLETFRAVTEHHCFSFFLSFFFFGEWCNKLLKLKKKEQKQNKNQKTRCSYIKLEDLLRDVWIARQSGRLYIS